MLFNSYIFIFLFLPAVLLGWWMFNKFEKFRAAQAFLVGMSLVFYGYANIKCVPVLVGSCLVNYVLSYVLSKMRQQSAKKAVLVAGCVLNIGALGYFKYCNFFLDTLNTVFRTDFMMQHIWLPLGISFFTFKQLSFLVDRYKEKAPHYSVLDYAAYVTFFPQLISGPIGLHDELIPQFQDKGRRKFATDSFAQGIVYFVIGISKKVLLADTLAKAVNYGFSNIATLDSVAAFVVALAYTFELYFDFSGYSDMAVGIGKMLRIEIPDNFNAPYKSASVKEFWRRWHITLGRFFTTYVYIPLGGSRKGKVRTVVNTMVVFLLSGLWHGANWTFVFWGFLHGIGVSFSTLFGKKNEPKTGKKRVAQLITFLYVCFAFVFFRSDSMADGLLFFQRMFSFEYNGSLFAVAEAMSVSEIYIVTKVLSMKAPQLLGIVNVAMLLFVNAVAIFALTRKRTRDIVENCKWSGKFTYTMSVLFVWAVLSLSGVSTFLYFSF